MPEAMVPDPDLVRVQLESRGAWRPAPGSTVRVQLDRAGAGLRIAVAAPVVSRVHLRWRRAAPAGALVLGDAWERSYGDLEWRSVRAERCLPWTALVHDPATGATDGLGVEVRGGAFAFWTVDADGVGLWLDLRCGGRPVRPGDRAIEAAVVRRVDGEPTPFATQAALAALQCRDPVPLDHALAGANNWYYAYGKDFGSEAVLRDARTIVELADGHPNRPYAVIDDGWAADGTADGRAASAAPWDRGRTATFPDMPGIAAAIEAEGARPGIWYRPLLSRPRVGSAVRERDGAFALDPTEPAVAERVAEDAARFVEWGFRLIKHDFSTYDLLGTWGWNMGASPAAEGPGLADPSVTTAEALVGFYRTLRTASRGAVLLGCDTVGHLAAGLEHAQRTGDDTSGREWDRTRRVGVNTLGFRLAQHGRFFAVDADCVPSTPATDWGKNRQLLDLVARSGTLLFVSVDPRTRTAEVDRDLSAALRLALDGGSPHGVQPVDWLTTPTPASWRDGARTLEYDWVERAGANPLESIETAESP